MEIGPHPVTLVEDLRRGERQAFVRFYELYRLPVYNLVFTLTHGSDETPSIVRDVFITAYRQMLLSTGPIELTPWICRVAVTACQDYVSDGAPATVPDGDEEASDGVAGAVASQWQDGDLAARFAQALDTLSERHQVALLLTDVHGLQLDEIGLVFGLPRDGARSLLFRAREGFRQAFAEVSAQHAAPACRLAEQAAAASVGRRLSPEEERKLREHAGYCRACRRTMKAWPLGISGLALFLADLPLPPALEAAPVFAAPVPVSLAASEKPKRAAAGVVIPLNRALRRTGAAVTSKAAAYAVAAVCLAATVGMALYVTQLDTGPTQQGSLSSAQRPLPHAAHHIGKAAVLPIGSGVGAASGQGYQLALSAGAPFEQAALAGGTGKSSRANGGAKQANAGRGSGGAVTGPQTGGGNGNTVGSGGATTGKGSGKAKPGGNGSGRSGGGNATKPGKGGGNGKATTPGTKGKSEKKSQKTSSKPAKATKPKAVKPATPQADRPKQNK